MGSSTRIYSDVRLILATISFILHCTIVRTSPIFSHHSPMILQNGRNIRHLPCISRRSGDEGVCMFAIDCLKANGTHLGTCIDRFYFGSCCQISDKLIQAGPEIVDNSIDQNVLSNEISPGIIESTTAFTILKRTSTSPTKPTPTTTLSTKPISTQTTSLLTEKVTIGTTQQRVPSTTAKTPVNETTIATPASITTPFTNSPSTATTEEAYKLSTFQSVDNEKITIFTTTTVPITTVQTDLPTKKVPTNRPSSSQKPTIKPVSKPKPTITKPSVKPSQRPRPKPSVKPQTQRPTLKPVTRPYPTITRRPISTTKPVTRPVGTRRPVSTTATKKPVQKPLPVQTKPVQSNQTISKPSSIRPTSETLRPTHTKPTSSSSFTPTIPTTKAPHTRRTTTSAPEITKPTTIYVTTVSPTTQPTEAPFITISYVDTTTKSPITETYVSSTSTKLPSTTIQKPTNQTQLPTSGIPSSELPSTITFVTEETTDSTKPLKDEDPSSTTQKPGFVTWTNLVDGTSSTTSKPSIEINNTSEWTPITPPDEWVLLPSVTPSEGTNNLTTIELIEGTTEGQNSEASIPLITPDSTSTENSVPTINTTLVSTTENATTPSTTDNATITSSSTVVTTTDVGGVNMSDFKNVCGRRMYPEARIVGGAKATFGKWPWQISLRQWRTSTYLHKCGAALLNENWAITAAHCVDNVAPSDLLLRLGEHDLALEEEAYGYQERRVQIVASHPQFDARTFEYDLALLRFYEPVIFQPNILPVCVPHSDEDFVGRTAHVTGWGRLYEDGPLPSILQEVSVPVINNTVCETMYRSAGYIEHIPNIFICAGWRKGGFDSCEGDSGGPMVIQRDDRRFLLAGIISWGIGCAEPNQPGVYTRISEFRDWINQILQF